MINALSNVVKGQVVFLAGDFIKNLVAFAVAFLKDMELSKFIIIQSIIQ